MERRFTGETNDSIAIFIRQKELRGDEMKTEQLVHKNTTAFYAVIQALHFAIAALISCYASAYLLYKGFDNGQIGTILGFANVCSACFQPVFAMFVQRTGLRLGNCMIVVYAVMAAASAVLFVLRPSGILFLVSFIVVFLLQSAMQSSVNALYRGYHSRGIKINFGLARGFGSVAYSLASLGAGLAIHHLTPDALPGIYLVPCILMCILLLIFHAPNVGEEEAEVVTPKQKKLLLRQYPHFYLFLAGIFFLAVTHCFTETYLLQIIQRIGGTSANLGVAIAIASITELPAMILYRKTSKKVGNRRLLVIAGWMWAIKSFVIMFAPSIPIVYAAELLQFVSYAIYVPASVRYIAHAIPETEFLKGQALAGSAFTVGSLVATFLGGQMIERFGMDSSVWVIQIFSVVGIVLFTYTMFDSLKKFPGDVK